MQDCRRQWCREGIWTITSCSQYGDVLEPIIEQPGAYGKDQEHSESVPTPGAVCACNHVSVQASGAALTVCTAGAGEVGWSEVEHWIWPLFEARWRDWRATALQLPPLPLPPPPAPLPPPPPLLYALSEALVPRPGWWPPSVHLCGPWQVGWPPPP